MSLRAESLRVYRQLFRAAAVAAAECSLHNSTGLQEYVSQRFTREATGNKKKLHEALLLLNNQETSTKHSQGEHTSYQLKQLKMQRRKILKQFEILVSKRIDYTKKLGDTLLEAGGNPQLTSVLQVSSAGIGNDAYRRMMESSLLSFFKHEEQRALRNELEDEATSERQNRIMQQAIIPYGERLLLLHRTSIGEHNHASALLYLSPWQATEAIVGNRSGATAHHLHLGRDHVIVEIDETFNKQVIYVCCTRGELTDSGSYQWEQAIERVDVTECEELQRTLVHSEFLLMANRLCDAVQHETPVHPSRKTVLVGHSVGGAVSLLIGMLLLQRGFEVSNVITFGAPKCIQSTLQRYIAAVNPVRVVLVGDPLIELPVTGTEGNPFIHVGEILMMSPRNTENHTSPGGESHNGSALLSSTTSGAEGGDASASVEPEASETELESEAFQNVSQVKERYRAHFLVEHYIHHLCSPNVEVTYAEGDEVWDDGDYASMRKQNSR